MIWKVCFVLSCLSILIGIGIIVIKNKQKHKTLNLLKPIYVVIISVFIAITILFIPIYTEYFNNDPQYSIDVFLLSMHNAIRLFFVDADFDNVWNTVKIEGLINNLYIGLFGVLYVISPFLSFGFVLSFCKNLMAYIRLCCAYNSKIYVFSELNKQSIILAKDILRQEKKSKIVFANAFADESVNFTLEDKAAELGAILFKKNLYGLNFGFHSKKKKLTFFMMNKDDVENLSQSVSVIHHNDKENCRIYIFSSSAQSELLIRANSIGTKIEIRRIDKAKQLISNYLYENGHVIIEGAKEDKKNNIKMISAISIGMGRYGLEMAKDLPWFCQLDGYRIKLNVFDLDEKAQSKFNVLCPGYLDENSNRVYVDGEAQYDITIHSGMDYETSEFLEKIKKIKDVSFVFVALGSDEKNIKCASYMRMVFERMNVKPRIVTVVYNINKMLGIQNATAIDGRPLNIEYIGDMKSRYSARSVFSSELEKKALEVHMKYIPNGVTAQEHERKFWCSEYNYNSSCASAMHRKLCIDCRIIDSEKEENELTEEESKKLSIVEHRRWNAYVKSCGYIYSGSPEKLSRNDLAKVHNCLIPFKDLSREYQEVDKTVLIKNNSAKEYVQKKFNE